MYRLLNMYTEKETDKNIIELSCTASILFKRTTLIGSTKPNTRFHRPPHIYFKLQATTVNERDIYKAPVYYTPRYHCRPYHRQWCIFTVGYELKNEKNDWGWAKTDSEGPHHCRFVAWTGSVLEATYQCRFKPQTSSDLALSLSALAKNRRW